MDKAENSDLREFDLRLLRTSFRIARNAREAGNHPFGAVLADEQGTVILASENTVVSSNDLTGHAETNLMKIAAGAYDSEFLGKCTIYASTEPCPMCAGAIFWANVKRVVYGLSEKGLYQIVGGESEEVLEVPCREILHAGRKNIEVIGPLLEDEASEVHKDFWDSEF